MDGSRYWADDGRRRRVGEQLLATANGTRLAEIRKSLGLTQASMAATTGLPRGRISQIECGEPVGLAVLRAYVTGLGGRVEVVATFGNLWLKWCDVPSSALGETLEGADRDLRPGRIPEGRERPA